MTNEAKLLRQTRWLVGIFIVGLIVSGVTALPLQTEVDWMVSALGLSDASPGGVPRWLLQVQAGLRETNRQYPFMAYGCDWLAFAHIVIAINFVGAWREPVRNRWLFDFGLIACALVIPWALVLGAVREIPFGWRLIDCSFGVGGAIPLWLARRNVQMLASEKNL